MDKIKPSSPILTLVELPVRMSYSRRFEGGVPLVRLEPRPIRQRAEYDIAMSDIQAFCDSDELSHIDSVIGKDDDEVEGKLPFSQRLHQVMTVLAVEATVIDDDVAHDAEFIASELARTQFDGIGSALRYVVQWRRLPDANQEAANRIHVRAPNFLLFSEADRSLLSEYDIQTKAAVTAPPAALANLTRLAQLDLVQLRAAIKANDDGRVVTMQNRANRRLASAFTRSWRQSAITVELNVQRSILKILIKENDDIVTGFDERSAGLRMFVALAAFIASQNTAVPPVLLIDEAENHLHYDAQADLVNMLLTQQEAAQVIYTTHSPGCLPPDLGTGIRAVVPSKSEPAVSEVRNSFWAHAAGFSPILLAMGAGAAAFTASRYAVLAEGASEMILMPSLIRAATSLATLPYQVAPGLSEAPTSHIRNWISTPPESHSLSTVTQEAFGYASALSRKAFRPIGSPCSAE